MSSTILDDYAAWLARPVVHQVPVWTFETFHTAKCRASLEDPGARCVCRPPFAGLPSTEAAPPISGTRGGR